MRIRRADQCFALLVSLTRYFTTASKIFSPWAVYCLELKKRLGTRYVQYSFIFVRNLYHFSRMAESSSSRPIHSNDEGTAQLQTNENPSLTVGLRAESSGLEKTLGHINQNMAKMSSLLERMCGSGQQNFAASENSPPVKRPPKRKSPDSFDELSQSEDDCFPPRKRFEDCNSDDNVSLYADDDLDCDSSIKELTERKNSTPPVTDHNGGKNPATLLKSLVDSYEEEDATGDDIDPDVAELLKRRWGKKLNAEKIKEIVAKHKRPANCPELKPIRVNPEIWGQLTATQKKADLKLTNFQQLVRKVTIINLQTTDWLASNTQNNTDLLTKSVDSLAMLGHLNTQLAQLRRDQIQPALKPEYKQNCAIEVPANSQYLFGDDIAKQLKDVRETSKISRSVAHTSNKKPNGNYRPFRQTDRGGFSNNYNGKSQSRNF